MEMQLIVTLTGLVMVTGCQSIALPALAATSTKDASISAAADFEQVTLSPQPQSATQGVVLPPPLYFLGEQSIWLLGPGDTIVEQITPGDWGIASFDVWPEDSRIAYGTSGGQLYVMMPGQKPRLLHDVSIEAAYPTVIRSVSWSPDGTHLAYTVDYSSERASSEAGFPSYPSGLWLLDIDDAAPTWLLSNHHLRAGDSNVSGLRTLADPVWASDSTALMLRDYYWEGYDALWLDPIAPDLDEANLHDSPEGDWGSGSWARDSGSILLSGQLNHIYGDLVLVERASLEHKQLIDGESEGLYVGDAQELPSGVVFLGMGGSTRLYLGHWNGEEFGYSPTGPEQLCDSGAPGHVEWDSTGQWGVLVCEYGPKALDEQDEVHIVTLNGENINITPYLRSLANVTNLRVLWGK